MFVLNLLTFFISAFAAGCSTTPKLDKNYGKATEKALNSQKITKNPDDANLMQAKEVKSAYDGYLRGGAGTSSSTDLSAQPIGVR